LCGKEVVKGGKSEAFKEEARVFVLTYSHAVN
jgi:hypothetical protein